MRLVSQRSLQCKLPKKYLTIGVSPTLNEGYVKGKSGFEFMETLSASGFPETVLIQKIY